MDVVDTVIESLDDLQLEETFQLAGALGAQHANIISTTSLHQVAKIERAKNVRQPESSNDLVNATNLKGLTVMDVVDTVIESPEDPQLTETCQLVGALGAHHANTIFTTSLRQAAKTERAKNVRQPESSNELVNATNLKGLTTMDAVDTVIESPEDCQLKETFQLAGALSVQHANTISTTSLHQAAKTKLAKNVRQPESSNDLVNATNLKGLTAMDVVDTVIESPEEPQMKETFQLSGTLGAQHANTISTTSFHQAATTE